MVRHLAELALGAAADQRRGDRAPEARLRAAAFAMRRKLRHRLRHMLSRRTLPLYAADIGLAVFALVAAHVLRFGLGFGEREARLLLVSAPLFAGLCACVFPVGGLYTVCWRFATLGEVLRIPRAVLVVSAGHLALLFFVDGLQGSSRLAVLIAIFILIALLAAARLVFHVEDVAREFRTKPSAGREQPPVLIVGVGPEAEHYISASRRDPSSPWRPIGLLDRDRARVGLTVGGAPILGSVAEAGRVIDELTARGCAPRRLVFTEPLSGLGEGIAKALIDVAEARGVPVARLPRPGEFGDPRRPRERADLRPIEVADLLERPQASLDRAAVSRLLAGRRILVTGAGGSIGSELCLQIAAAGPAQLTLVDNGEFNLYQIDLTLGERFPGLARSAHLCDVRDRQRVERIFRRRRPEIVFHAAALKHVPMVELNPAEGALTNVVGSRNVAEAARSAGALAMVQVSTDKAVNTSNVMGATKRVAELLCQALDIAGAEGDGTRFMTVRFGNVLGSSGSLVPLFQRQIAQGGPLTVTDEEMRRFFMTIPEAVALTLHASALGLERKVGRGAIFVLDMGEPVRIVDIARRMIRLAGLTPDRDVAIRIVGARPGEKLFEELFGDDETRADSAIPGVFCALPRPVPLARLAEAVGALERAATRGDARAVLDVLARVIDGYVPSRDALTAADGAAAAKPVAVGGAVRARPGVVGAGGLAHG
jgi:O-antigen biosynthesis protein WbqV